METNTVETTETVTEPKTLEMIAVESTNIEAIGFDEVTKKLYVKFTPRTSDQEASVYSYDDATEELFQNFLASDSKGTFFTVSVKNRAELPHTKMPADFPHKVLNVTDGEKASPNQ